MATKMTTWRSRKTGADFLKLLAEHKEICIFDTETTGLNSATDRIIQISGIKLDTQTLEEIDRLDLYINPGYSLPPKITEITGITDEQLADKPTEDEAFPTIFAFFDGAAVGAYNTPFDKGFMINLYARQGRTFAPPAECDVLEMSKDIVEKGKTPNHKLGTIANYYQADEGLTFHNSMDDVIATVRVLRIFKEEYKKREANAQEAELVAPEKINSVRFWEGYRGFSRQYIHTDIGTFYFDIRSKVWGIKASDTPYSLNEVDMEAVRTRAFEYARVANEQEFARFRG